MADATGQLVLQEVAASSHQLPVSAQGQKELRPTLTMVAGQRSSIDAGLENVGPTAGEARKNTKDGLKYVWIPPGTFMMGCSPGDNECTDDEKPAHQVTITRGFWIGQTPVTVGGYKRFAGATGQQMPETPRFNSAWAHGNMPIVRVTWDDAQAYCGWMGGRLLTEAEWEYAGRAGSTEARYGSIDEVAWYINNAGQMTHEVAQKRANAFGLYDMLGNVWEWVNDWYGVNYYSASPEHDPRGPDSGQWRILRGGSWYDFFPRFVRVSSRVWADPGLRNNNYGFRCVEEVNNSPTKVAVPPAVEVVQPPPLPPPDRKFETKLNPKDGLNYVWMPSGTFMMGCSLGDNECGGNGKPTHQVTITRGFWIGQAPVTVGAYKRFAGTTRHQMPEAPDFNNAWAHENMLVVNVN